MFRIESYITPIILSHIDKYVKDFRPQDAQVSLWGGEAAFQNLDVRLDVLEEELQFPFSFVSGHIHELTVRVPWTKIASEPIQITINTIEFVLKLKTESDGSRTSLPRRRPTRSEVVQEPPGYMASLINKIANNISIKLNNIILKYVEEDIVVSMNIQLLTFDSADDMWQPAFVDINPTKIILKKLINISDLTICLDKRNAMGKIDVCQEPILYRCSLQIRLLYKYNISSAHRASLTRLDVFTESIELNVSAQQYPMLLRLISLAMALRTGELRSTTNLTSTTTDAAADDQTEESQESMIMWAWNMLPSIFPVESYEDEDEQKGHVLHTGIYVNHLKITFKSLEIMTDTIVHSTKKLKYHPILMVSMSGIYCDSIVNGKRWFSVKGGISNFGIHPADTCPCGKKHIQTSILASADIVYDHSLFLTDSLKDVNCAENQGKLRLYDSTWDQHLLDVSEDDLRQRTPAISFDLVHFVDLTDDDNRSTSIGSDLEYSNISENYLCRSFIGKFNFKFTTGLMHIIETLREYAESYDYIPYVDLKPQVNVSQLNPPSTEDFEALMTEIPLKYYECSIQQSIIEIHISDHEYLSNSKLKSRQMSYIIMEAEKINVKMAAAYYPNRLVYITCQLPEPPSKLIDSCYTKLWIDLENVDMRLWYGSSASHLIAMPDVKITFKELLQPELWTSHNLPKYIESINVDVLNLKINKPQFMLLQMMWETYVEKSISKMVTESSLLVDIHNDGIPIIDVQLNDITCAASVINKTFGVFGHIDNIHVGSYVPKMINQTTNVKTVILTKESKIEFLNYTIQFPHELNSLEFPPIFSLSICDFSINLDPILCQFISYEPKIYKRQVSEPMENTNASVKSPRKSFVSMSRKSIVPPESVHSSSDPTAIGLPQPSKKPKIQYEVTGPFTFTHLQNLSQYFVVLIRVQQISVFCPIKSLHSDQSNNPISELLKQDVDINYILYSVPIITIASSHIRNNILKYERNFPIELPQTVWNPKKDAFPWNFSLSNLCCVVRQNTELFEVISAIETKITLAVSTKPKRENEKKLEHSIAIHIDTPPIKVNLCMKQMEFLYVSVSSLLTLFSIGSETTAQNEPLEVWERPSSPNYHSELKEFFGTINTISEDSSDETLIESDEKPSKSLLIQWTLAKLSFVLSAEQDDEQRKLIIDLEDIITSVGKQDIYVKIKTKINSLSVVCKTKSENSDEWIKNELLGVTVHSDALNGNNQDTFFDLTITKAQTKNVHDKWGAAAKRRKKNQNLNETLTEIMICMQTLDIKLNFKMLESFCRFLALFTFREAEVPDRLICVSDLPLVFFKSKGMRIFVPISEAASEQFNVLIFKVNSISIQPTVENPLNRIPIRGDIYTKAAQLRILSVPGSKIEDRQYEMMFENISFGSGKWEEIVPYMDPHKNEDSYNENPAFDWNNQTERPSVEINTIFKNFNLSVTYAPSIIFKNVLVCGQGLEINCLTDLSVELNTRELSLVNSILDELRMTTKLIELSKNDIRQLLNASKLQPLPKSTSTKQLIKINSRTSYSAILKINEHNRKTRNIYAHDDGPKINVSENQWTADSGFESFEYNAMQKLRKTKSKETIVKDVKCYPYDITFVGGVFSLKFYHYGHLQSSRRSTVHFAGIDHKLPLLAASLFQPNMFISQTVVDKTVQLSLFSLSITFGCDTTNESNETSAENEFNDIFFDTKQGDLGKFGIPPDLLIYKEYITPANEKNLDLHIKRPMFIKFSHKTLEKLFAIRNILDEFIAGTNLKFDAEPLPITTSNKIKIIQNSLYKANRINFSVDQMEIDCSREQEYDFKFGFTQMDTKIDIVEHPQKLLLNFYLKNCSISTGPFMILSPLTMNVSLNLIQENWKRDPGIFCNLTSNCVDVSLSPEAILNAFKAKNAFLKCMEQYQCQQTFMENGIHCEMDAGTSDQSNLMPILTPRASRFDESTDEFYQDDLRAGAFQFIESNSETTLPLPYQIQIVCKNGGIISWRYPQPRSLTFVKIFPVPFHTSVTDKMKCQMEYYSDAHSQFMPYCEFYLSEKEIYQLELPSRKVTAEIWRIKIIQPYVAVDSNFFQEESSTDDEDDKNPLAKSLRELGTTINTTGIEEYLQRNSENISNLHPRALVGCMRIDSSFSSKSVPIVQAVLKCSHLTLSFKNNCSNLSVKMPDILSQYKLSEELDNVQSFLKLNFCNLNMHLCHYEDERLELQMETLFSSSILDYSYLLTQPLIEEFSLKVFLEYGNAINVNIVANEIRLRYGPLVGHALLVASQIWQRILTTKSGNLVVTGRYIFCNATTSHLKIGQHQTQDVVHLQSKECGFYGFRSDRAKQKISISYEESNWTQNDPISISKEGSRLIKTPDDRYLIVKTEKISGTQKKITIKGQVELLSMTQEPLKVQYLVGDDGSGTPPIKPVEFDVREFGYVSLITRCEANMNISIRLRLNNVTQRGWSGEIPLAKSAKNAPWVVKIPTAQLHEFESFWVRVIRETITGHQVAESAKTQRILIVIWPLFMVRSMLPMPTRMMEITTSNQIYALSGKGNMVEVAINGTHETTHDVLFEMRPSNKHSNSKALLCYKAVDRGKFFAIPSKLMEIDNAVAELEKSCSVNWPCSREEELRWDRPIVHEEFIHPIFKVQPSRELSCSLMLDILPCSIFFNSVACTVKLIGGSESCTIPSNHFGTTFPITDTIIIAIVLNEQWIFSNPIYIASSTSRHKVQPRYELPDEGSIIVKINSEMGIGKFMLTSTTENGVRMLFFSAFFVICNFSSYPMICWAFCAARKEKEKLILPAETVASRNPIGLVKVGKIPKNDANPKGNCIVTFFNLSHGNMDRQPVKDIVFTYFLSLSINSSDYSPPFLLNRTYTRVCFSIPSEDGSVPLALSVIENDGQQFVCIHDDPSPVAEIINKTDLNLYIAEVDDLTFIANTKLTDDEHFDRVRYSQSHSSMFYTPHSINQYYPDKVEHLISIVISCDIERSSNSSVNKNWSLPIKLFEMQELFLNLPQHGDIKIIVNTKDKIVKLIIDNIDYQMEFNVKDIRTKLSNPAFSNYGTIDEAAENRGVECPRHATKSTKNPAAKQDDELTVETSGPSQLDRNAQKCRYLSLNLFVSGVNITLYNDHEKANCIKTELISFYFDDIGLFFDQKNRSLEFGFLNIQIDNQLFSSGNFDFPVVLCSQKQRKQKLDLPTLYSLQTIKNELLQTDCAGTIKILFYAADFSPEQIHCKINQIAAYIEDKYINCLLDFMVENIPMNLVYRMETPGERVRCQPGEILLPKTIVLNAQSFSEPVKIRVIRIEPVNVLLSVHTCMRMYIALDHSPLTFGAFERKHIYSLPMRIGYNLGMHYVSGAIFGAGWVVGSLEILGSPSGLARSVSTGLRDFLSMPVQGLLRGPWGFLVGVTQGSASLLRNITAGTVNSLTKLAASVARNLDRLTLDEEHLQRTEALRRIRPQGITDGFAQGLTGLGISILGAVGGLARHTLEAKNSVDVFTGLGKGLVGVLAKPISGAAELVALTGQGMLHTVGFNTMPIPRNSALPKNTSLGPAAAKIIWKYLPSPRHCATDQILFLSLATLETRSGYSNITIVLTSSFICLISMDRDEIIEIIANEQVYPEIDKSDATMITLNISKNSDNEGRETEMFQYSRVLQYIRDSSDQLPTTSKTDESSPEDEILDQPFNVGGRKTDHKISLFMDQHLGQHFVMFVEFLKRTTKQ